MTTDATALQERIARAIRLADTGDTLPDGFAARMWDEGVTNRDKEMRLAAAVLPIIAAEAKAAKAEAWRACAAALEAVPDYAPTEYDKGRVDQRHATIEELYVHATEYETGDRA